MMEASDQKAITAHLQQLYADYRHTANIEAKAHFFSPACRQICRPRPGFAARERETIMRYLREASGEGKARIQQFIEDTDTPFPTSGPAKKTATDEGTQHKSFYTIRPLTEGEEEFGNDESAILAGFDSASSIKLLAENEGWVGMRVDLWDDEGTGSEGEALGILVKVQYWWKEGLPGEWSQILHDIMYLGSRDGTEGTQGQIRE
ncbi:hypothetical protein KVR01_003034 [Diaporthe batatas]|uniref:uncharacterized protein n=1 Tax=Diaporthe batatas TaxID=748121 RepID=UPI001D039AC7|nr:uncharacterized protein KVR01_003034 [Diaporthe batatas]KAG8167345.1 hypothetical protein KVR01_003034 [Diaporthe batatas]